MSLAVQSPLKQHVRGVDKFVIITAVDVLNRPLVSAQGKR
jgi:hypothetical protein